MKIELTSDEQAELASLMLQHAEVVVCLDALEDELEDRQDAINDFVGEKINQAYEFGQRFALDDKGGMEPKGAFEEPVVGVHGEGCRCD